MLALGGINAMILFATGEEGLANLGDQVVFFLKLGGAGIGFILATINATSPGTIFKK